MAKAIKLVCTRKKVAIIEYLGLALALITRYYIEAINLENAMTPSSPHQNWRNVFLGRQEELEWLEAAWKQTTSGEGPQMRVFTAESGYGKTKMAHAFYTRLSTAHDPDGYWPDNLLHEEKNLRVMPDMTDVNPRHKIPWFWWGLRWENPDERNRAAICSPFITSYEEDEFQWHQKALLAAVNARNATWRALFSAGKLALALFPGAGSAAEIASACSDMRDALGVYFDHAEHKKIAEAIAKSEEAKIQKLLTTFSLLLDPKKGNKGSLPVVLLLDDAQWMDSLSLRIVQELWQLARKNSWPLMVLATHWQKEWNKGFVPAPAEETSVPPQTFARWVWQLQHPAAASCSAQPAAMSTGCIDVKQLGRLEEVRELLQRACPGLLPEQADFICEEAAGNPRHITEIVYKLEREPEWFVDKDATKALKPNWRKIVTPEQFKLATLERERFAAIERPLKKMLGTASLQGNRFLQEFTLEVAEKCGFSTRSECLDNAPVPNPLHAAENPHAVAEARDEHSMEFRSNNIRKCAASYLEECEYMEKVAEASADTTRVWIQTGHLARLPLELRLLLLQAAYGVAERAVNRIDQALFLSTALEQIERSGNLFYAKEWIALWEKLKPTSEDLTSCDFWTLHRAAYFLYEAGRFCLAEFLANELEAHPTLGGHREDANTGRALAAVNRLRGDLFAEAGKREAALECYLTSLSLSEQLRERFGDTPECLRDIALSLNNIAVVEHWLGQTQKALERYMASLSLREQIRERFGETPARLSDIASALDCVADLELDEFGQTQKALERYMASLSLREQIRERFGETPACLRETFLSLGRIADVEHGLGQTQKALERYRTSLTICEQLRERFGETPERLRDVAFALDRIAGLERGLGQTQKALERFMASLAICEQLREQFGDTPERLLDVARSLGRVADVEHGLGQTQQALERFMTSLAVYEQLRERFGDTPERLRDLSVSHSKLALIVSHSSGPGTTVAAREHAKKALALAEEIIDKYKETPDRIREKEMMMNLLAGLEG